MKKSSASPKPVLREALRYLKFFERQRTGETPMDNLIADTWEKLGPAPEFDCCPA